MATEIPFDTDFESPDADLFRSSAEHSHSSGAFVLRVRHVGGPEPGIFYYKLDKKFNAKKPEVWKPKYPPGVAPSLDAHIEFPDGQAPVVKVCRLATALDPSRPPTDGVNPLTLDLSKSPPHIWRFKSGNTFSGLLGRRDGENHVSISPKNPVKGNQPNEVLSNLYSHFCTQLELASTSVPDPQKGKKRDASEISQ